MVSQYMVGFGRERRVQNGLCSVESGRSEEVKAVRNRLGGEACLLLGAMLMSGPGLLPRQSLLTSVTPVIIEPCEVTQGLGCHIRA